MNLKPLIMDYVTSWKNTRNAMTRSAYWPVTALVLIAIAVLSSLQSSAPGILVPIFWLATLAAYVIMWLASMRRLTDAGFHPLLILLAIIPGIGILAVLVLCAFPTKNGARV